MVYKCLQDLCMVHRWPQGICLINRCLQDKRMVYKCLQGLCIINRCLQGTIIFYLCLQDMNSPVRIYSYFLRDFRLSISSNQFMRQLSLQLQLTWSVVIRSLFVYLSMLSKCYRYHPVTVCIVTTSLSLSAYVPNVSNKMSKQSISTQLMNIQSMSAGRHKNTASFIVRNKWMTSIYFDKILNGLYYIDGNYWSLRDLIKRTFSRSFV